MKFEELSDTKIISMMRNLSQNKALGIDGLCAFLFQIEKGPK